MELYISPSGNDKWSGRLAKPNTERTDGPLASLEGARRAIRARRTQQFQHKNWSDSVAGPDWPITVWVRGGIYPMQKAVVFTHDDSFPVTFKAYAGETPIFDGGVEIAGWEEVETNGRRLWKAKWDATLDGRQLWVNGERVSRSRWPKAGYNRIKDPLNNGLFDWGEKGSSQFVVNSEEWQNIEEIRDLDAIVLHFWVEERMPVASFNAESGLVASTRTSVAPLNESGGSEGARYFLENVIETLSEPGEWAFSTSRGEVYYVPHADQKLEEAQIFGARAPQLLELKGDAANGHFVQWLRFEGLTFRHTAAVIPGDESWPESQAHADDYMYRGSTIATAPQAAVDVPGVVRWTGTRNCALVNCTIEHAGWYALELGLGCQSNRVEGNLLSDIGAGGIHIVGRDDKGLATGNNRITDNEIKSYGHVFQSAVGVVIRHSSGNLVAHNYIHHGFYTAISVGWAWSFYESQSHDNVIEWNHIHDIGRGALSDMGGIYMLGVAPGTIVRYNVIHDVVCAHYGGWAIYADEGSSHLIIEKNLCYNCSSSIFHQHWGRENTVRNNLFAFGRDAVITVSNYVGFNAATFTNNIFLSNGLPFYLGGYEHKVTEPGAFRCDSNLFWDTTLDLNETGIAARNSDKNPLTLSWQQWQSSGRDIHSRVADPQLPTPLPRNIQLPADSPALAIGFEPFDVTAAGIRTTPR